MACTVRRRPHQFQSTFPQGERHFTTCLPSPQRGVSIHVPARGTTQSSSCGQGDTSGFNPRSRKGNDHINQPCSVNDFVFQSTFPQGERLIPGNLLSKDQRVSIHVPARGTTLHGCDTCYIYVEFQSTFPQGERRLCCPSPLAIVVCFNPRSRKGNDRNQSFQTLAYILFQSTFPQGERRRTECRESLLYRFQSTFPQGERQQSSINFLYISCYYLCNYTNIIPVMQAQLTILISLYLNITVRISQTLYAHFCFAPIRYCIAALFNITKTTITLCS